MVTNKSEKVIQVNAKELKRVICIQYSITFQGGLTQDPVLTFFDLGSEVNAMHPDFANKLDLIVKSINAGFEKIYSTIFETYEIVVVVFLMSD